MRGDFFAEQESLLVSVMPMSIGKSKDISLNIGSRNLYTSEDILGYEDTCLPDDIYCFSTISCGVPYSINRAFLCSTYCKIEQLKAKAKSAEDWENIREIKSYAEAIESNAEFGKIETATDLLKILNKKLKNIKCGAC